MLELMGKSAKPLVAGVAGCLVLYSDSYIVLYYIGASLINALLSKALKRPMAIPRPAQSKQDGHGMPSSHAQTLVYFLTVCTRLLLRVPIRSIDVDLVAVSVTQLYVAASDASVFPLTMVLLLMGYCGGAIACSGP